MERIVWTWRTTWRREEGASLVEAAFLLPLLFALVLGMITFGDAYFTRLSIEDAVRDAARFASTMEDLNADGDPATETSDETILIDRVVQVAAGELARSEVCVALVTATGADTTCDVDDPDGAAGEEVIKVKASTTKRVEVIFFARDLDLTARSAAPYAR